MDQIISKIHKIFLSNKKFNFNPYWWHFPLKNNIFPAVSKFVAYPYLFWLIETREKKQYKIQVESLFEREKNN